MKNFTRLLTQWERALSDTDRATALDSYFQNSGEEDWLWAIWLLLQNKPRKALSPVELKNGVLEATNLPEWLFEEARESAADLAEAAALMIGQEEEEDGRSLKEMIALIFALTSMPTAAKQALILTVWKKITIAERYWFNRLLLGTFRFKLNKKYLVEALVRKTNKENFAIWYRLSGDWSPGEISFEDLFLAENASEDRVRPYPMAKVLLGEEEIIKEEAAGDWQAEWRRAGIEVQLMVREGQWSLWSEEGEWLTAKFPEFSNWASSFSEDIVISGTLLGFKEGQFLPLKMIQDRIAKKGVTKKTMADCPVIFQANDLWEYQGQIFWEKPLLERWAILEQFCAGLEEKNSIVQSELAPFKDWETLDELLTKGADFAATGLLLRRLSDNASQAAHFWPVPPFQLLAILLYVTRDERNPARFSGYTFALWKGAEELIPITKGRFVPSEKEEEELKAFVQQNTIERFGPVISVQPLLVFSISYTGIRVSNRRKSGLELISPEVLAWEKDREIEEVMALADLRSSILP